MKQTKDWAWKRREKGRKGFTLIELIVVMAVIGILVLLAAPRFIGKTEEAQFTKHINNAKVLEDASERYYIDHGKWPRGADEDVYTPEEVSAYAERIYDITGSELSLEEGDYWDIDYSALASYAKLPSEDERANYVLRNPVGKVYYLEGLTENRLPSEAIEGTKKPENGIYIPENYVLANDIDFDKDANGNFRYIGNDQFVVIPHEIHGEKVTSYKNMFRGTEVYGVLSDNPLVTDMSYMFYQSKSTTLDLSNLDTSNVTDMANMFGYSKAETLDLTTFDTSNVTTMAYMFRDTLASALEIGNFNTTKVTNMTGMFSSSSFPTLNLSNFNTSSVTLMTNMFRGSSATSIDLSNFDTSNVTSMFMMFYASSATTLDLSSFNTSNAHDMRFMFDYSSVQNGYARNSTDAYRLNVYTNKPSNFTFNVR